ncbi:hypothetical protein Dimus_007006 [Dionaea muscipula]
MEDVDVDEFSPAPVIAWLMYTRDTVRQLHYRVEPSDQRFPCLRSLSLSSVLKSPLHDDQGAIELASSSLNDFHVEPLRLDYGLQGSSSPLQNVTVLELGWTLLTNGFSVSQWVAVLLERCPNLDKLIVCGIFSQAKTHEECRILGDFVSSMIQLMRRFKFEFE